MVHCKITDVLYIIICMYIHVRHNVVCTYTAVALDLTDYKYNLASYIAIARSRELHS